MSPYPDLFEECRVVRAGGELDVTTASAFADDLEAARCDGGPPFLIVDLRDVTFMDGSVLDPLCAAWHDSRRRGGWVRVVHVRPGTTMLFRSCGLLTRFPRYASPREAWQGRPAGRPAPDRTACGDARSVPRSAQPRPWQNRAP
ncbi:anti-sigma B factor antagonist [Streptomyces sp. SAI-126]|uniref:STAS domain-containing protein n=1 Tax=Streptomyces sp. SAI-126 TaxID=3377732 RepID=UPI003C7DBB5B